MFHYKNRTVVFAYLNSYGTLSIIGKRARLVLNNGKFKFVSDANLSIKV